MGGSVGAGPLVHECSVGTLADAPERECRPSTCLISASDVPDQEKSNTLHPSKCTSVVALPPPLAMSWRAHPPSHLAGAVACSAPICISAVQHLPGLCCTRRQTPGSHVLGECSGRRLGPLRSGPHPAWNRLQHARGALQPAPGAPGPPEQPRRPAAAVVGAWRAGGAGHRGAALPEGRQHRGGRHRRQRRV